MRGNVGVEEISEASATGGRTSLLPIAEGHCYWWQGCSGTGGRGGLLSKTETKGQNQ